MDKWWCRPTRVNPNGVPIQDCSWSHGRADVVCGAPAPAGYAHQQPVAPPPRPARHWRHLITANGSRYQQHYIPHFSPGFFSPNQNHFLTFTQAHLTHSEFRTEEWHVTYYFSTEQRQFSSNSFHSIYRLYELFHISKPFSVPHTSTTKKKHSNINSLSLIRCLIWAHERKSSMWNTTYKWVTIHKQNVPTIYIYVYIYAYIFQIFTWTLFLTNSDFDFIVTLLTYLFTKLCRIERVFYIWFSKRKAPILNSSHLRKFYLTEVRSCIISAGSWSTEKILRILAVHK